MRNRLTAWMWRACCASWLLSGAGGTPLAIGLAEPASTGSEAAQRGAPSAAAAVPPSSSPRRIRLSNGLEVLLLVERARPRVGIALSYRSGKGDDPQGYGGLAHVAEHALFEGSAHIKRGDYWLLLEQMGATHVAAETALGNTTYSVEVPRSALARALWIEAERAAFVLDEFDQAGLERARAAVRDEAEVRWFQTEALPQLYEAMYGRDHPESRSNASDIEHIRLDHVRWFVQQHYRPDNATLAVVGSFDADTAERLVRNAFEPWRSHGPEAAARRPQLKALTERATRTLNAHLLRNQLSMGWPVSGHGPRAARSLAIAAAVMTELLRESGALYAGAQFKNDSPRYPSAFLVYLVLPPEMSFATGSHRVEEALSQLCGAAANTKLQVAIARHRIHVARHWDEYAERAATLARRPQEPASNDDIAIEQPAGSLSAEDVHAACRQWLLGKPAVELRAGQSSAWEPR